MIILLVCISFAFLNVVHRLFLPSIYSSVREFVYENNLMKLIKSSSLRYLYIIAMTLVLRWIFLFDEQLIFLGIFVTCFLNIWPPTVMYRLFGFYKSTEKLICLLGYVLHLIFPTLVSYATIRIISPMIFENAEFFLVDNTGIGIIISLALFTFPISLEAILAKVFSIKIPSDVDLYREEARILNQKIDFENYIIRTYKYEILSACRKNNVSTDLLKTIILLEQAHRGIWYIILSERLLCRIFPKIAIKKDITIGLTQIKISTAHEILEKNPIRFMNDLLSAEYNIEVAGKLLGKIITDYGDEDFYDDMKCYCESVHEYIANKYLCSKYSYLNRSVLLYTSILKSKCENVFFVEQ